MLCLSQGLVKAVPETLDYTEGVICLVSNPISGNKKLTSAYMTSHVLCSMVVKLCHGAGTVLYCTQIEWF